MRIIRPDTQAHAYYDMNTQKIAVRIWQLRGMHGDQWLGKTTEFERFERNGQMIPPTLELDEQAAQELMDSLWDVGIRPAEGKGSAGQMGATLKHLEDMQAIAYQALRFNPPAKR